MSSVQQHYDNHLARYYVWLFGGWEDNLSRNRKFLVEHGIAPAATGRAIDLGCGPGFYAVPLAEAGFAVTAVDTSAELLGELESRSEGLAITVVAGDMLTALQRTTEPCDVCLCMGDTLAHLGSREEVEAFLQAAHSALAPDGLLVLSFRDYTRPLAGAERFIPVRSDDTRIAMCALEYRDEIVEVADITWECGSSGWEMTVSSYSKLRMPVQWVVESVEKVGFDIVHSASVRGFVTLIGRRKN